VGEHGGADALVEQVLRRGALGPVVVVPGPGARGEGGGVLVGQGEHFGPHAVLQGAGPAPQFSLYRLRSFRLTTILTADLGARFVGQRHGSSSRWWTEGRGARRAPVVDTIGPLRAGVLGTRAGAVLVVRRAEFFGSS